MTISLTQNTASKYHPLPTAVSIIEKCLLNPCHNLGPRAVMSQFTGEGCRTWPASRPEKRFGVFLVRDCKASLCDAGESNEGGES